MAARQRVMMMSKVSIQSRVSSARERTAKCGKLLVQALRSLQLPKRGNCEPSEVNGWGRSRYALRVCGVVKDATSSNTLLFHLKEPRGTK